MDRPEPPRLLPPMHDTTAPESMRASKSSGEPPVAVAANAVASIHDWLLPGPPPPLVQTSSLPPLLAALVALRRERRSLLLLPSCRILRTMFILLIAGW